MEPTEHPSNNHAFTAPEGHEDTCVTLHVTRTILDGHPASQSFWKLSEEEKALIAADMPVVLTIYGIGHPMVSLSVLLSNDRVQ
jgi:hypothetical protein